VKIDHAWTQSRWHLGNRRKNPRDRISYASSRLREPGTKAGKDGSHRRTSRVNCVFFRAATSVRISASQQRGSCSILSAGGWAGGSLPVGGIPTRQTTNTSPGILNSKQDQSNHKNDNTTQLISRQPFTVSHHAEYNDDKSISGSNG